MNNYQKIAAIVIRVSAITFLLSTLIDAGIVSVGFLLISLERIPREVLVHEIYILQGTFSLVIGIILYVKSESLARYIIDDLQDEESTPEEEELTPED